MTDLQAAIQEVKFGVKGGGDWNGAANHTFLTAALGDANTYLTNTASEYLGSMGAAVSPKKELQALYDEAVTLNNTGLDVTTGDFIAQYQRQEALDTETQKLRELVWNITLGTWESADPTVTSATKAKTTTVQKSVTFTLDSAYTDTAWTVYAAATGAALATGVTASNDGTTLTLAAAGTDIAAAESGKVESSRLKLTVTN
ncbi:hypothetical protein AGMMS4952_25070 [Spirochaetia bacterium]|nr:hypothetical protein AGMMS4952_25070 [Spirochaetia bacterium]